MRAIGVALVGTGFALRTQLPALRLVRDAVVRVLVGRDAARTAELARQHGIESATHRLEEALSRDDVDLVCIATPPDLHRSMSEAALAAGKHVLCEKPMTLDVAAAESMLRDANGARRIAVVDHQLRFAPTARKMRRLVHEGYVGAPLHAHATILQDRWIDPRRPHEWWQERARGGGVLGAFGSHAIDWLRWTLGDVESAGGELHTVFCERPVPGEVRGRTADADDFAAVNLRLAGGVRATLLLSVVAHRGPRLRLEVYGSEGMLLLDADGRLWGSRCEVAPGDAAPPQEELSEVEGLSPTELRAVPDSPWAWAFVHEARALIAAVGAGQTELEGAAGFADGLEVQRVLDAVRAAAAGGQRADLVSPATA